VLGFQHLAVPAGDFKMQPLMFDERTWLAWLVKARILILTLLLGIELAVARLTPSSIPIGLFVFAIVFWFGISLFFVLLLSVWQEYRIQSALQVVSDLFLVTLVVHVTGGVDSSLNFLYPLAAVAYKNYCSFPLGLIHCSIGMYRKLALLHPAILAAIWLFLRLNIHI